MTTIKRRVPRQRGAGSQGIYDVAVLQKALDLLEVLADQPDLGLSELNQRTGASKASTYRLLSTLEGRGFVTKDDGTRKYSPGPQLVALSCAVVSRLDLVTAARPSAEELQRAFGETVNVGILVDTEVLYVDILESAQGLRMAARVGARDAPHSTALGKAMLSAMPASEARDLLTRYRRLAATPRTITALDALMEELARVADRGYAIDDQENEMGARCVGAAIRDGSGRVAGAMSVSGPSSRIPMDVAAVIGDRLVEAVAAVEARLGVRHKVEHAAAR